MITIYHLETSRSERIVWLMEELGLEYKLEVFPRESTGAAPAASSGSETFLVTNLLPADDDRPLL